MLCVNIAAVYQVEQEQSECRRRINTVCFSFHLYVDLFPDPGNIFKKLIQSQAVDISVYGVNYFVRQSVNLFDRIIQTNPSLINVGRTCVKSFTKCFEE